MATKNQHSKNQTQSILTIRSTSLSQKKSKIFKSKEMISNLSSNKSKRKDNHHQCPLDLICHIHRIKPLSNYSYNSSYQKTILYDSKFWNWPLNWHSRGKIQKQNFRKNLIVWNKKRKKASSSEMMQSESGMRCWKNLKKKSRILQNSHTSWQST